MTRSLSGGARAVASIAFPPVQSKAPRERLVRLAVEADPCPQVFLRTLGFVAQQALIPLSIGYECKEEMLRFEIIVDDLSERAADTLLHRVCNLVTVREAKLLPVPQPPSGNRG